MFFLLILENVVDVVLNQGRERWLLGSRQGSANTSEGNNRDSSLDDSGVVDDHDDGEATSQSQSHHTSPQPQQCGYHQLPQVTPIGSN
jgi:hypothetical protein